MLHQRSLIRGKPEKICVSNEFSGIGRYLPNVTDWFLDEALMYFTSSAKGAVEPDLILPDST
jgi:hypothetical protein